MSGAVEATRARPLSGGLWTLFSWLRRDEHSSTESVSSAGSARTAASFAFLAAGEFPAPRTRPPPSPPSDSYRRRVRERSLRRQRERDLTLHRKYGLYGLGFDGASLPAPSARRCERDRRAASESPRAHVPGKRRAPPPPVRAPAAATLPRPRARKRPAPPPPTPVPVLAPQPAVLSLMDRLPLADDRPPRGRDETIGCKPEKYSKKDTQTKETKDVKIRPEKSFLKHIFENKKRNSGIETASLKLLPNISELDKQAAEMIEKYRLREMTPSETSERENRKNESTGSSKQQTEAWICTRCLRKYDSSVITCNYCLPLNKSNDFYKGSKLSNTGTQTKGSNQTSITAGCSTTNIEDKEKLKELLKEMKDSLPKRPKSELIASNKTKNISETETKSDYPKVFEAATLRIGSSVCMDKKPVTQASNSVAEQSGPSTSHLALQNTNNTNNTVLTSKNSVIITQPVVLVHTKESNVFLNNCKPHKENSAQILLTKHNENSVSFDNPKPKCIETERIKQINDSKPSNVTTKTKYDLNTPLKISSLLNPIYVPKTTSTTNTETKLVKHIDMNDITKEKAYITAKPQPNTAENVRNTGMSVHQSLIPTSSQTNNVFSPITEMKKKLENKNVAKNVVNINASPSPQLIPTSLQTNKNNTIISETKKKPEDKVVAESVVNTSVSPSPELIPTLSQTNKNITSISQSKNKLEDTNVASNEKSNPVTINTKQKDVEIKTNNSLIVTPPSVSDAEPSTSKESRIDQHARRRDLIHQLERSIAQGDEKAAAEAAVKLAQLKLSCSVLSFSSQIVGDASTSSHNTPQQINVLKSDLRKNDIKKVDEVTQKYAMSTGSPAEVIPPKQIANNVLKPNIMIINNDKKQPVTTEKGNIQIKQSAKPHVTVLPKVESAEKTEPNVGVKTVILTNDGASTSRGNSAKEQNDDSDIPILVWVEDKETTRGPVQLHVRRSAAVGELRRAAERALGLPARLQRWIVGRTLCTDESAPLAALAGPDFTAPFYLCLVETDTKTLQKAQAELEVKEDPGNVYHELVKLEKQPLVSNAEAFECGVCIEECRPGAGVVLRECVHSFCKECLSDVVRHSEEPVVGCPAAGCRGVLQEREVRGLVSPADYETWLARGLAAAESGTRNAFHCRTRDCVGWALCDPGVRRFPCPVCKHSNCVPCQAIHEGETCEQHRAKAASGAGGAGEASQPDEGTRALLQALISRGEALECPECSAIITKKWGCDWIKCSACKTEICWVTRGRRWGPAGRGDTSAGCRCGVDGKRCHPSCAYCH